LACVGGGCDGAGGGIGGGIYGGGAGAGLSFSSNDLYKHELVKNFFHSVKKTGRSILPHPPRPYLSYGEDHSDHCIPASGGKSRKNKRKRDGLVAKVKKTKKSDRKKRSSMVATEAQRFKLWNGTYLIGFLLGFVLQASSLYPLGIHVGRSSDEEELSLSAALAVVFFSRYWTMLSLLLPPILYSLLARRQAIVANSNWRKTTSDKKMKQKDLKRKIVLQSLHIDNKRSKRKRGRPDSVGSKDPPQPLEVVARVANWARL